MLDDKFSSSLIIDPLAVHEESGCGGSGARDIRGVDTRRIWLVGSLEGGSAGWGMCGMHGCSRARTKSMATSAVSKALEAIPGRGFSYVELKSRGDKESSGGVSIRVQG